jgi:hypothetical protein
MLKLFKSTILSLPLWKTTRNEKWMSLHCMMDQSPNVFYHVMGSFIYPFKIRVFDIQPMKKDSIDMWGTKKLEWSSKPSRQTLLTPNPLCSEPVRFAPFVRYDEWAQAKKWPYCPHSLALIESLSLSLLSCDRWDRALKWDKNIAAQQIFVSHKYLTNTTDFFNKPTNKYSSSKYLTKTTLKIFISQHSRFF